MTKKEKKLLAVLMVLIMGFTMLPGNFSAAMSDIDQHSYRSFRGGQTDYREADRNSYDRGSYDSGRYFNGVNGEWREYHYGSNG